MDRFAAYATLCLWLGMFLLVLVTSQVTGNSIQISQIDYPVGPPIGQHEAVPLTDGVECLGESCDFCFLDRRGVRLRSVMVLPSKLP